MAHLPPRSKDISGATFSSLTAVRYIGSDNGAMWLFSCSCGNEVVRRASRVTGGHIRSCGCLSAAKRFAGPGLSSGEVVGKITAVRPVGKKGHNVVFECLCQCGRSFTALASNIISGNTKSCGCHRRAVSSAKARKHGLSDAALYGLWSNMMRRCYDEKNEAFKNYGARGILVCERWHNFANFYADMGERPKGKSLERKNNSEGYSPENCAWVTRQEQARNTRANVRIVINGESRLLVEWAELSNLPIGVIWARKNRLNWKDEELLRPLRAKKT